MATANVIVTRTGTGFTVDVTACDLDPTLTLKDFVVLHNGTLVSNADYTKTTQTILTYTGTALAANTSVEVRRRTPTAYIRAPRFGSRISSADWTNELDRITRRAEEYELNGVGSGSITGSQSPQNDPFGVTWASDIIYPPTRKAVYDWGVNLVSNSALATTLGGYVTTGNLTSTLVAYAPLGSPSFTGNPTVPTQAESDNSTRIASTAYVKNNLSNYLTIAGASLTYLNLSNAASTYLSQANAATTYAPLSSPGLTGNPTAPTQAFNDSDTSIATTAFVSSRLRVSLSGLTADITGITANQDVNNWGATNALDPGSSFNRATGTFTCPQTGYYRVSYAAYVLRTAGTPGAENFLVLRDTAAPTVNLSVATMVHTTTYNAAATCSIVVRLTAGNTYRLIFSPAGGGTYTINKDNCWLSFEFLSP